MKRNNTFKGFSVCMALLLAGCASYAPSLVKLDPSGPNVTNSANGGLTVYVEEYATPEKSRQAFDADLAKQRVLPLLILVENGMQEPCEVRVSDISVQGNKVLKALTPEEAAKKAKRGAVGRALGWSLIVPIISIPIAAVASATHTSKVNKQILHDFQVKALQDGVVMPNKDHSGFLFFELDKEQKDLSGLSLEMTARNTVTGELVTLSTPLPPANFTPKEKADSEEEQKDDIAL